MKILNYTPHNINIIDVNSCTYDAKIRKYISENPEITQTIPSSGMLNAKFEIADMAPVDGIPQRNKVLTGCDPIPAGDVIIVSALYYTAASGQDGFEKLRTVIDPVFDATGTKIIGYLAIGRI